MKLLKYTVGLILLIGFSAPTPTHAGARPTAAQVDAARKERTVQSAAYGVCKAAGATCKRVDYTRVVNGAIVSPSSLGVTDPAPGFAKNLFIEYQSFPGGKAIAWFKDGDTISLPAGAITKQAFYGTCSTGGSGACVTVDPSKIATGVIAGNNLVSQDPMPNAAKKLYIKFTDGTEKYFNDGSVITGVAKPIPVVTPTPVAAAPITAVQTSTPVATPTPVGVSVSFRGSPAILTEAQTSLINLQGSILHAYYGNGENYADVTAKVKDLLSNRSQASISSATFGVDPAPGYYKYLTLDLSNGKYATLSDDSNISTFIVSYPYATFLDRKAGPVNLLNQMQLKALSISDLKNYVNAHASDSNPANYLLATGILAKALSSNINLSSAQNICATTSNATISSLCTQGIPANSSSAQISNLADQLLQSTNPNDAEAMSYFLAGQLSNNAMLDTQYVATAQLIVDIKNKAGLQSIAQDALSIMQPAVSGILQTVSDLRSGNIAALPSDITNDVLNFAEEI